MDKMSAGKRSEFLAELAKLCKNYGVPRQIVVNLLSYIDVSYVDKYAGRHDQRVRYQGIVKQIYPVEQVD